MIQFEILKKIEIKFIKYYYINIMFINVKTWIHITKKENIWRMIKNL